MTRSKANDNEIIEEKIIKEVDGDEINSNGNNDTNNDNQVENKNNTSPHLNHTNYNNKRKLDHSIESENDNATPTSSTTTKPRGESDSLTHSDSDSESYSNTDTHRNSHSQPPPSSSSTLYLDTIDRSRLDFDFEKVCSVSLSIINIYACLCCGKYFQGRGKSTHAYVHSVDVDHHVFINLQTLKIYILPEGYEVKSTTLDDIKYVVNPTYAKEEITKLDQAPAITAYDLNHKQYCPGFVGINNIKVNDYSNVILQILSHVPPIRDYFILLPSSIAGAPGLGGAQPSEAAKSETIQKLSILIRKIWNPKAFKAHVSPHELLQHISGVSRKQFTVIEQKDPFFFLTWFLNHLDNELKGGRIEGEKKPIKKQKLTTRTIIQKTFSGSLLIQQQNLSSSTSSTFETSLPIKETKVPFLCLTLDLPPVPLFKGSTQDGAPVIPQVSLKSLLSKYNGETVSIDEITKTIKKYTITKLPQYLILRIKRITRNIIGDSEERNPTVVSFSPTNLDMSSYISTTTPTSTPIFYDLIANVICAWDNNQPRWKIQLLDKSRDQWFQIENLLIQQIQRELLFLDETHIQIWQRR